ncbi:MAG: hypothetical protein JOS17DRAFT_280891 [Linnemannia elongata]|nr:MAG: hypothetical protein JOS17DRAFT_280891 [Linnemannia elongata]
MFFRSSALTLSHPLTRSLFLFSLFLLSFPFPILTASRSALLCLSVCLSLSHSSFLIRFITPRPSSQLLFFIFLPSPPLKKTDQ